MTAGMPSQDPTGAEANIVPQSVYQVVGALLAFGAGLDEAYEQRNGTPRDRGMNEEDDPHA